MLPDLPKKTTERLYCDMTGHDVRLHGALVAGLRGAAKGANHLGVLHRLPALVPPVTGNSPFPMHGKLEK
jgi:hypothetical protein